MHNESHSLRLGRIAGSGDDLKLPASARERHVYVCGGTGVGKSKFLEHCIRQDILDAGSTGSGLLLLDPHGLVYQNVMAWLARYGLDRDVVPIDLRRDDWVVCYNLLRQRSQDPTVTVSSFVRALAHVWGEGGTDATPLFARWASVILLTLYQNGYAVTDAMQLLSRSDVRRAMSRRVTSDVARQAWEFAERNPREFDLQVTSTLNRFQRLVGPPVMRATFGQPDVSLDLGQAIERGKIVLVNLSTEGGLIDEEDADTFATLLLTDLWAAAKARGKSERDAARPFYVYVDECQNFVTPTIAANLDQARGFGLHLTLANQYPSQFLAAGPSGKAMYDSVLAHTGTKVVFRLEHPGDARALAEWLFIRTLDADEVKLALEATKVLGYREETRESVTRGTSRSELAGEGQGAAEFDGVSHSRGSTGSLAWDTADFFQAAPAAAAAGWNETVARTAGGNRSWSRHRASASAESASVTVSQVLVPVMGREVSSVQFRPIDEQIFRATQRLFDQEDRHFAVRFPDGPKAPHFVLTPTVSPPVVPPESVERYRLSALSRAPFAMPMPEAIARLDRRASDLLARLTANGLSDEPATTRRRIR